MTNCTLSGNRAASGGGANLGSLYNCQVSFNSASAFGGGVASNTVINCVLEANSALSNGGGACRATALNCAIIRNLTSANGGGVYGGWLTNCAVAGNSALFGGGADSSTLNNCIVYHNDALSGTNYNSSALSFCCTVPTPDSGPGNITAEPQFADQFHLSAGLSLPGRGQRDLCHRQRYRRRTLGQPSLYWLRRVLPRQRDRGIGCGCPRGIYQPRDRVCRDVHRPDRRACHWQHLGFRRRHSSDQPALCYA